MTQSRLEQIAQQMEALGQQQAAEDSRLDFSLASVGSLRSLFESKPRDERDYLKGGAYLGEVLRKTLGTGSWIAANSKIRSKSGAPMVSFGEWRVDPVYQLSRSLDDGLEGSSLTSTMQLIVSSIEDGVESGNLTSSYEFPSAWDRIAAAIRARRFRKRIARRA